MTHCEGDGSCFQQDGVASYIKTEECACELIRCSNYWFCKKSHPQKWINCWNNRCRNCDMIFNQKLKFSENIDQCTVCLEPKILVKEPRCNHYTSCEDCFIQRHEDDIMEEYPDFPYPEIYEQYENHPSEIDQALYPLIQRYQQDLDFVDERNARKYMEKENLRKCPLCRG